MAWLLELIPIKWGQLEIGLASLRAKRRNLDASRDLDCVASLATTAAGNGAT
jgi:hypothetical protein